MEENVFKLFITPDICGFTINTVWLNPSFRTFMYVLILFLIVFVTAVLTIKKSRPAVAFKRAVIIAFFASGTVYAFQADIGWATWIADDIGAYVSLENGETHLKMEGELYDFTKKVSEILHEDYQVYSSDLYREYRMEYWLLPLCKRSVAKYVIVLYDKEARFDPVTGTFIRGNTKITNVERLLTYAPTAYLLKRNRL